MLYRTRGCASCPRSPPERKKKFVTATGTNFLGNYRNKYAIGHHCGLFFHSFDCECDCVHLLLQACIGSCPPQTINTLSQRQKNGKRFAPQKIYFFAKFFSCLSAQDFFQLVKAKVGHVFLGCAVKFL